MQDAAPPEFSRLAALDRATETPQSWSIEANQDERAALARRFGLLSLGRLVATLTWRRQAGDLVRLDGVLEASLAQPCVVTLDPVPAELTESFTLRFMRGVAAEDREVVIDPEADDPPEPLGDGPVDVGEIVAQQLALALDPYPRAAGVDLGTVLPESEPESPFGVLRKLRPRG
ncbi:MAG: DUF177 domain-containing protein [Dongiaceae bacterium]